MAGTSVEKDEGYSEQSSQNVGDVDYISCLPESLCLHIISFLEVKDAAKMSILSRGWRDLWTYTPNLIFFGPRKSDHSNFNGEEYSRRRITNFFHFVDRTLRLYQGHKIQKFQLSSAYSEDCMSLLDNWIKFATKRRVEELKLETVTDYLDRYELPRWVFQYESLRVLKLRFLVVKLPSHVCMRSLKTLSLSKIRMNNSLLNKIMTGCPQLVDFSLLECDFEDHIHISSLTLQRVRLILISKILWEQNSKRVEVDAPNLVSINISGCVTKGILIPKSPSSLGEARIRLFATKYCRYTNSIKHQIKLLQLIGVLSQAKVLRLCKSSIQVLSTAAMMDLPASVSSCNYLIFETGLEKFELPGLARVLRTSPGVEILTINVNHYRDKLLNVHPPEILEGFEIDEEVYLDSHSYPCLMDHVKTIKVSGLLRRNGIQKMGKNRTLLQQWLKREVNLIKFLLKNTMVLERMILKITDKKYFQMLQQSQQIDSKLLALPRASPNAEVSFLY
ncbi:putative F-box/LRR-repeat protein At3g18150 [Aristolochia californica]|uniref:putative F-box/LRR-repeat protein At3g18150 n=1 Tax=Aristolochia californica TaxID=171875 RepID=UPI0035E0054D